MCEANEIWNRVCVCVCAYELIVTHWEEFVVRMWMSFWLRASLRNHMLLWRGKKEKRKKRQAADVWLVEQQHNRLISVNQLHQGNELKLTAHFLLLQTVCNTPERSLAFRNRHTLCRPSPFFFLYFLICIYNMHILYVYYFHKQHPLTYYGEIGSFHELCERVRV